MSAGYDRWRSNLLQAASMAAGGFIPTRAAVLSSYDADAYLARVKLQPEDLETDWLPIAAGLVGQRWGVFYGPTIGDQCLVTFLEGDINAGCVVAFLPSDEDPPPRVESGEIHLRAKGDEASVILKPNGDIASKGKWTHEGTFHATETISTDANVEAEGQVQDGVTTLAEVRDSYNAHTHSGVQGGAGNTGPTSNRAE